VDHWDTLVFVEILWICQVYKIALRDAVSILFVETKILYSGLNLIILVRLDALKRRRCFSLS
jgi:hypothetical protein